MLKPKIVSVLLVTALSLVALPAQAQSRGYRPSTGYGGDSMTVSVGNPQSGEIIVEEASTEGSPTRAKMIQPRPEPENLGSVERGTHYSQSHYSQESCESCSGAADDCGLGTCGPMGSCHPRCFWGRAEYLGWWKQGMNLPALVTTNSTTTPTLANANTTVLFGDDSVNKDAKSGGRYTLGMWIDSCKSRGIEFTYLRLGGETTSYNATSDDYTTLGRPFFNIETGAADANLISYASPAYTGWVNVEAKTKFQGTELLYHKAVKREACTKVDFLFGWRWLQLKDDLMISESVTDSLAATVELSDQFSTKNNFHGVEFGVQWERPVAYAWTLEVLGKMALGNSRSSVTISGQQTGDANQGLLALDSNSGTHTRDSLATVTELGLSLKRRFNCGWEASFGYTFVYWSDVMRAGDQIDLNVDPRQIPPTSASATHPEALMNSTDFWTQGLHCGLEYNF